ncbi:MAG: hypothetical protein ACRC1K_08645, partial [Planctomycetia bacterium]
YAPGLDSANPRQLAAVGDRLYFVADGPAGRRWRVWTPTGATTIHGLAVDDRPTALGDVVYIAGDDGVHGRELHRYTPDPFVDEIVFSAASSVGVQGRPIPLNVVLTAGDGDGSESTVVAVVGLPIGATLSLGRPQPDGSWLVDGGDLPRLAVVSPTFLGDFTLSFTATVRERSTGATAVYSATATVSVQTAADPRPTASVHPATGPAGGIIPLRIAVESASGGEVFVEITGLPAGSLLTRGSAAGAVWTVALADLPGLALDLPPAVVGLIPLHVRAVDRTTGFSSQVATLPVFVVAPSTPPAPVVTPVVGDPKPADGRTVVVTGVAESGEVTLVVDGVPAATAPVVDGRYSIAAELPAGDYDVQVRTADAESPGVRISIDGDAPAATPGGPTLGEPVVNRAPELRGAVARSLTGLRTTRGLSVATLLGTAFRDADGNPRGVAVTNLSAPPGARWQLRLGDGKWRTLSIGALPTGRKGLLLRSGDRLRLIGGTRTAEVAVSFRAWDQTEGVAGKIASIRRTGGDASFGRTTKTIRWRRS